MSRVYHKDLQCGQLVEFTTNDKNSICIGRLTNIGKNCFGREYFLHTFLEYNIYSKKLERIDVDAMSDGSNFLEYDFIAEKFPDQVVKFM